MDYHGLGEPDVIKPGRLCMSQALGIVSLVPLAEPTTPPKLLQRLMLGNWTPAILVEEDGSEHQVVADFWQSAKAEAAFQNLVIEARVHVEPRDRWRDGPEKVCRGWIVFDAGLVRRAVALQLPTLVGVRVQRPGEAMFDEALKRWRASGMLAQPIDITTFAATLPRMPTEAERIATVEAAQRASASLSSAPGLAPDLVEPPTPKVSSAAIGGESKRIEGSKFAARSAGIGENPRRTAKRTRTVSFEKSSGIANRIHSVIAEARRRWPDLKKAPSTEAMAKEMCGVKGACHDYAEDSVRQILDGRYPAQMKRDIKGYRR